MAIQGLISDLFKDMSCFSYKGMIQGLTETYLDSVLIQENVSEERPHIGILYHEGISMVILILRSNKYDFFIMCQELLSVIFMGIRLLYQNFAFCARFIWSFCARYVTDTIRIIYHLYIYIYINMYHYYYYRAVFIIICSI